MICIFIIFWVLNEILESAIFIFKLNTNIMSIIINVKFHNTILMHCIIKMPLKYLLVKFDMNDLFYAIFKIPMILCDFIISSGTIL